MKSIIDTKEQEFLQSLEKKLWTSADKLRRAGEIEQAGGGYLIHPL